MIDQELGWMNVLVVDDIASNRQILAAFLGKMGARVLQAEDGMRAVEMFAEHRPDVVLMDVMMPEMDGLEATRRIKATSDYWVPVIFLSALGDTDSVVAGLEAGGDDYLAKPFSFVVLNAKLRSLARTLVAQRRLDESRRLTQAILDNIEDCVVTIDDTGKVLTANAATRQVFGYDPAELLGRNIDVLMPDTHRDAHARGMRNYLNGGAPQVVGGERRLLPGVRRDGTGVLLELAVTEMRLADRRQFVGVMSDVSERVAAEQKLRQHAKVLERYREDKERENAFAAEILERLQHREGLRDPRIGYWLSAASDFSGDVVAVRRSPTGKLYAMLADGTGHGLAAAISLLPVLTAFYGLAERDYPLSGIVFQMNHQLKAFMPTGRFVAATAVRFDPETHTADVWIGGMPDLLLVGSDGVVQQGFAERHLPLGIVDFDIDSSSVQSIDCPPGSQLLCFSDGISEATDTEGRPFGIERICTLAAGSTRQARLAAIKAAVSSHLSSSRPQDDLSLLLIDC